jgi:hypothetical protein
MRLVNLLIATALVGLVGCNNHQPPLPVAKAPIAASYKYKVKSSSGAVSMGEGASFTANTEQTTMSVQDGHLIVNRKGYGRLNDGDSIVVDENGRVTVNGSERSPEGGN